MARRAKRSMQDPSGEWGHAMRILGNLPRNQVIQNSNGTWSFVGRVDASLRYVHRDGTPITDKEAEDIRQVGAGFFRDIKTVVFPTKEAALGAARALGVPASGKKRHAGGKKRRAPGRVVYEGGFTKLKTDKTVHIMVPGDTKKMYCGRTRDEFVSRIKTEGVQTHMIGRDYALKLFDIVGYDAATSKLWPRQKLCPECKKAFKEREADVLSALASAVSKLLK
jgi:hypothetical protein